MALRGTILVAEDEGLARHILTEILQEEGYLVYEAADGNSALKILDEVDIDCALRRQDAGRRRHRYPQAGTRNAPPDPGHICF